MSKKKEDSAEKKQKETKLKQSKRKEKGSKLTWELDEAKRKLAKGSQQRKRKKKREKSPLPFDQLHALFLYSTHDHGPLEP